MSLDKWYTPAPYIEAARSLMGRIDLDPASCEAAQRVIQQENGLAHRWCGRVWLNPPFSLVDAFVDKLLSEYEAGLVCQALLLVNASTDTIWFEGLAGRFPVLFTRGRIRFWHPDHPGESPRYGQALFGLGINAITLAQSFRHLAYLPNQLQ